MFRCPGCGQAHKIKISKSINAVQPPEMDEVKFFYAGSHVTNENDIKKIQVAVENSNDPSTCEECNETHSIKEWLTAFSEPLIYFEMEELCHCGGELWMDNIPGTNKYGFVCDKCNWVKPKKVVSGA